MTAFEEPAIPYESSGESQPDYSRSRLDIQDLLARYTIALDTRNLEMLRTVFTGDAEFDFGIYGAGKGLEWFTAFTKAGMDACKATYHLLGQSVVEINGEVAHGQTYLVAQHIGLGDWDGELYTVGGWHIDQFALTELGWRIAHRRVVVVWTQGDIKVLTG